MNKILAATVVFLCLIEQSFGFTLGDSGFEVCEHQRKLIEKNCLKIKKPTCFYGNVTKKAEQQCKRIPNCMKERIEVSATRIIPIFTGKYMNFMFAPPVYKTIKKCDHE